MLDTLLPYQPDYENDEYLSLLIIDSEDARQLIRLHTLRNQGIDKRRYDSRHRPVYYNVSDLVWIFIPVRKVGLSEKLLKKYFGPYNITKKISDVNYEPSDMEPNENPRIRKRSVTEFLFKSSDISATTIHSKLQPVYRNETLDINTIQR
ncbi:hypothetical protein LAZ67_8001561 [Cordylochernes scorpioides]|uniref:Uncharacterized protein n=1 Tax=Cordylochernes scorpioides TaxID=51811 RepID=A0ABY6KT51_9ARAC|nr:hypothetical protein LAZ67_8001561 [Cordylochernes scorpioides]